MSVLGIIAEYNPFHNGHLYHFNTSVDLTQAEYSVCALSGSFMQRGEPAIIDKWSRTLMALKAGIDLVIEIPVIYCAQSAEFFAFGSVSLLDKLGIVDNICFGSEYTDTGTLDMIAQIIESEPSAYKKYLDDELVKGLPFASARSKAAIKYITEDLNQKIDTDKVQHLLKSSNSILGLEYMKWLKRLKSSIKPVPLKRMHSSYNDKSLDKPMASAAALRKAVYERNYESLKTHMPDYASDIMLKQFDKGNGPVFIEDFEQPILCILRRMNTEDISKIAGVGEGLEYKIKSASLKYGTVDSLIGGIISKRYPKSRIKRILINTLLGIENKDLTVFKECGPKYIRVLGFSDKGRELLQIIKQKCPLPIITNTADYRKYDDKLLRRMIEFDILSTDIYATSFSNSSLRKGGLDFYKKPVML